MIWTQSACERRARLLRAHVVRCADGVPEAGPLGRFTGQFTGRFAARRIATVGAATRIVEHLGHSEVDHLGDRVAVDFGDQDVRRLEVAMDESLAVGMLHRRTHLLEEPESIGERHVVAVGEAGESIATHEFHHEVRPTLGSHPGIEHAGDARVLHASKHLPFGLKSSEDLPRVHSEFDELECDLSPHRLLLLREPDRSHPALAKQMDQPIRADPPGHARTDERGIEQRVVAIVMPQQFRDLARESRIVIDQARERRTALRRNQLAQILEALRDTCE